VKIAHFSDVHALSTRGVAPWAFLSKRIAGYVNLRLARRDKHPVRLFEALVDDVNRLAPDEVIVTGDLTNLSLEAEFALARSILDRIELGPEHVTVVPGNHDVYTLDALARRPFLRAFRPYTESDEPNGEPPFPVVRVRGQVAIVGLSTAQPSPVPFADGWVGKKQLARLAHALERLGQERRFRILALHHPPYTNRASILRGLRDRGALQSVLKEVGCELVLHGHEHRDVRFELAGRDQPIQVIGVGSSTYDDARPERRARYNVYHLEGGRLQRIETRVHDPRTNRFESGPSRNAPLLSSVDSVY
jgi:3',5'-cyclic AMP phosphodiesterase CpdA